MSVKPVFDSFLSAFQTKGPLIHCLYQCMIDLIKTLLRRFMKPEKVSNTPSKDLKKLDVTKDLMEKKQMEIGPATRGMVNKVKSQRSKLELEQGMLSFYQTATSTFVTTYLLITLCWKH